MKKKYFGQQCQDEKINIAFRNLHKNLINEYNFKNLSQLNICNVSLL